MTSVDDGRGGAEATAGRGARGRRPVRAPRAASFAAMSPMTVKPRPAEIRTRPVRTDPRTAPAAPAAQATPAAPAAEAARPQDAPASVPETPAEPDDPDERDAPADGGGGEGKEGRAVGGMFRSLRNRNYRLFAAGQVVSNTGTWMQRVGQDWLVLELTHGSGTALGITTGLQFLPMLLFGLWGGVIADRYAKRRVLIATQVSMGVLALVLGLLAVTGTAQVWHVYLLAFGLGIATVVDTPTRQSFVIEMVGRRDLPNAIALNSAIFNGARLVGPAVAGVMIALIGTGPVFLGNAASFGAVLLGLYAMRPGELHPVEPVKRAKGQLREGLRYVAGRRDLTLVMVLIGFIGMFGMKFSTTVALMTKEVFGTGATAFGAASSMLALGALSGALLAARRADRPRLRLLVGTGVVFGVLVMVTGLMPTYWSFLALLVPTGIAMMTITTAANSTVQLGVAPEMRGRVMGLYMLVFLGTNPVGAPVVGWLAEHLGARMALVLGGLISASAALAVGALAARGTARPTVAQILTRIDKDGLRRRRDGRSA